LDAAYGVGLPTTEATKAAVLANAPFAKLEMLTAERP
jgi:hypothetical protein